ncbi:hypothetical protein ACLBVB_16760, partial [Pseudomonas aeruginosa]
ARYVPAAACAWAIAYRRRGKLQVHHGRATYTLLLQPPLCAPGTIR